MEEIVKTYSEFKHELDTELTKAAESFVRIGYFLKIARDTEILRESGYSTVAEFAKAEYGLSKDIVSRYIHINDRFSENGYSESLAVNYKGYGYSKLAEMLTLPDNIIDALTPQMTRQQIQEIKQEIKEEQSISPMEVMLEEKQEVQQSLENDLQVFVHQYGYDEREKFQSLVNATSAADYIEKILDILAPSGVNMLSVRIKGRGKLMLSIKGKDKPLELLDVRADSKQEFSWEELQQSVITTYRDGSKEAWETLYNEPYEEEKADAKNGGDRIVKLKPECATEEIKDELFDIWFDNVAEEKIKAACKIMSTMRFADLINSTPRKLFLLAQTSEITTEEVKQNGELLTKVEDSSQTALFTAQDFLKRFTKKFLDPYKEKQSESNSVPESHKNVSEVQESDLKQSNIVPESTEVAPVQQEKEKTKEGIAILAECVYAAIKQYREKLMNLSEYTVDTVKDALAIETTHFETWLEFIVEGVRYEAQVHTQAISKTKEVVIYEADSISLSEEYVWFIDEVYKEIADVLNFDEEALQEEQIPGRMHVSDYPEIQPESRKAQQLKQQSDYITMSFRCLPKNIVYFIAKNRVEEAIVTQITIEENWIPQIEVKTTDPNTLIVAEFDEKEDWGKILFKSKAAAEKALEEHITLEEQENK